MKYKTRGNAHPQGKPRVFFTGHPRDITLFFDKITDMILQRQNCAIFYDEDPTLIDDEEMYFSDLRQMQLIVIVVTSNFLYRENIAFNKVFRFAIENHIPVLPIMEERGLESEFNRLCGDLQFLDPNATDLTAISFEEKLSKYLSSVLVGDEMAAKVRAAFDAYVFLSYRKKDRKYAQELMRLIHKNEFCRDIAIWYDEFLVPGENFNESIKTALDKSELFALVVTPNLVNEENYVMTTEYPMAKKADKRILPAELLPTDTESLKTSFPQIPDCTDPNDEKALTESLLKSLEHVAKTENDNDPQHNFFIGLAYLSGIDVEVDHERAVELITSSANAGLLEAIEKLVAMYRSGEGVAINYETAIEWQRKIVDFYRETYETEEAEENAIKWIEAICELGDYIHELGYSNKAKQIYATMLKTIILCEKKYDSVWLKKYGSVANRKLGDVYINQRKLKKAQYYYENSLILIKEFAEKNETTRAMIELSFSYNALGRLSRLRGEYKTALSYFDESLKLAIHFAKENNTFASTSNLCECYNAIGEVYETQGDVNKALLYYKKTLQLALEIVEESNTNDSMRYYIVSSARIGGIYKKQGNIEKSLSYYKTSLKFQLKLYENSGSLQCRLDLSQIYRDMGEVYKLQEDFEQSLKYYENAVKLREEIKDVDFEASVRITQKIYKEFADVCYRVQGFEDKAKLYHLKAIKGVLNHTFYYHSVIELEEDILKYEECILKKENAQKEKKELSDRYIKLGEIYENQGKTSEAIKCYDKSLEIIKKLIDEIGATDLLSKLLMLYNKIGIICEKNNDKSAFSYYESALRIAKKFDKKIRNAETFDHLAFSYYLISMLMIKQSKQFSLRRIKAVVLLIKSYNIWSNLIEQYPKVEKYKQHRKIAAQKLKLD